MIPYVAYQYVKNKREANKREMEATLDTITSNLSRSMIPDQAVGVFIEWTPSEEKSINYGPDTSGWVLTEEEGETRTLCSPSHSPERVTVELLSRLSFSMDVNDLSSFRNIEPKKGEGYPYIRLISKDGSSYVPLYFTSESTVNFVDVLQRYITLRRSAREPNLVLVVDGKTEALAQSVIALGQNDDVLSRFMKNPYAAALTGFGKITSFMQEQMIPALLDSDAVSQEEQIRAMRELSQKEEDASKLRVNLDATSEFELVTQLELPPRPEIYRESPVTQEIWDKFKNGEGVIDPQNIHHLKMNVFRGGLDPDLRKEAWKYLLGYRLWEETNSQFEKKRVNLAKEYERLKAQWLSISEDQESRFFSYSQRKGLVGEYISQKDVARTDRSMAFFSGDGYVQGMSDFASPLLYVMGNEVDAFWCFVELMKKIVESHQSDDMYFCFRWVLVWFKRELSFADTCKLWEVLWTGQPCPNFLLLICIAILDAECNTIIANKFGLTEILKVHHFPYF
ncbi:unnamed protein product [Nippostrongylus brasiliensis]|uniref:LD27216p (inferred by orthology to a D. melanogaster protein) n=1 Tax=Nippostrongylus brasiliensis TaxID=27835 RepID=A0A0N4YDT3_NIPBR|nr:unnamed protein product [Nippostrongylus brasiliensis]